MSSHPKTNKEELIKHMLQALETPVHTLTKWEENFLESINEQFSTKKSLSDRQYEILDRLYSEKTN